MGTTLRGCICLLMLPLAIWAGEGGFPGSVFTLTPGLNGFSSSLEGQRGRNGGYSGRVEFLRRVGIPVGLSASLAYDLCPICDNTGGEYVSAISLVAQVSPFGPNFQMLTGIGYTRGNDPGRDGADNRFGGLGIPLIFRAMYDFRISETYLGLGVEGSLDWNGKNNAFALGLPLQLGRW